MNRFAIILVSLAVASQVLNAQQQSTLTPSKDNTLYQTTDGSTSNGSGDYLFVGRVASSGNGALRRALLRFNLVGSIPANATITSVTLTLRMSKTISGAQSVSLRKVNADWGEGTSNANSNEGSGATSATNDATWLHRFFSTTSWTTPGGDFSSTTSASASVNAVGNYTWGSTAQMVADVQTWLSNPSSNFGWILIGDEANLGSAKRFESRENPVVANRPKLTVTYTVSTSAEQTTSIPLQTELAQNFPNPFNPSTAINYQLSANSFVVLGIFDVSGRQVARLVEQEMPAGSHTVTWNANNLPSGTYIYRITAGKYVDSKKMQLLK